jgi:hypothetical protein
MKFQHGNAGAANGVKLFAASSREPVQKRKRAAT